MSFQDSVDSLLKSYFNSELANGGARYSEGVYAVALNPKTGAVLAMSGIKHNLETGDLTSDSLGTVTNVFVPGSVVKAATISSGWENGVLKGNQTLTDQPIVSKDLQLSILGILLLTVPSRLQQSRHWNTLLIPI